LILNLYGDKGILNSLISHTRKQYNNFNMPNSSRLYHRLYKLQNSISASFSKKIHRHYPLIFMVLKHRLQVMSNIQILSKQTVSIT